MASVLSRTIFSRAKGGLLKPAALADRVVINFWKPGYSIVQTVRDATDKPRRVKTFVPTSTPEAAMSFLIKLYGSEKALRFKDDIHPGHVSIATTAHYLSVGTLEEVDSIGPSTHHELVYANDFVEEVLAFQRLPEHRFDFYTLNTPLINTAIDEFKTADKPYSLLGDRLNLASGESCATATHRCLVAGGFEELLRLDQRRIGRQGILTPALLASFVQQAREEEINGSAAAVRFSAQFVAESAELENQLQVEIDKLREVSLGEAPERDCTDRTKPGK